MEKTRNSVGAAELLYFF